MNKHPDAALHERLAAYTLGAMDPVERKEFESELDSHLAGGCAECERALAEYSDAVVTLAGSAPAATPSKELRNRVFASIVNLFLPV